MDYGPIHPYDNTEDDELSRAIVLAKSRGDEQQVAFLRRLRMPDGSIKPFPDEEDDFTLVSNEAVERYAAAEAALRILIPPLVDCLRVAGDFDGNDLYELLAKAGITKRERYDPQNLKHNADWFNDGTEPEDEIWILTQLGREMTEEHPTLPPPQGD